MQKINSQKNSLFYLALMTIFITLLLAGCIQNQENINSPNNENISADDTETNSLAGTCPKEKDTPCTGECGQFVDSDKDGFCDRSNTSE